MRQIALPFLVLMFALRAYGQIDYDNYRASFKGIKSIKVRSVICDIAVLGEDQTEMKLNGIFHKKSENERSVKFRRHGRHLNVWVENFNKASHLAGKLEFIVPKDISITVESVSGNIYVGSINSNKVVAKNVSGSIHIHSMKGVAKLETVAGLIKVSDFEGTYKVKSTCGEQEFEKGSGRIFSKQVSGNVSLHEFKGDLEGKSTSGKYQLKNSEGRFNIFSITGDILGDSLTLSDKAFFSSTSGAILIKMTNAQEELSYILSSVGSSVQIGNSMVILNGGKYKSFGGPIAIRGISTSGIQKYEN